MVESGGIIIFTLWYIGIAIAYGLDYYKGKNESGETQERGSVASVKSGDSEGKKKESITSERKGPTTAEEIIEEYGDIVPPEPEPEPPEKPPAEEPAAEEPPEEPPAEEPPEEPPAEEPPKETPAEEIIYDE